MNIHIDMFWVFLFGMFVVCVIFFSAQGPVRWPWTQSLNTDLQSYTRTIRYFSNWKKEVKEKTMSAYLCLKKKKVLSINSLQVLFIKQLPH